MNQEKREAVEKRAGNSHTMAPESHPALKWKCGVFDTAIQKAKIMNYSVYSNGVAFKHHTTWQYMKNEHFTHEYSISLSHSQVTWYLATVSESEIARYGESTLT